MTKITNTTILSAFRKQMGLSKADATAFVEAFQSVLEEALLRDKSIKINGLGTFKLIAVEARKSVNVNTGKEIKIAEHYKLTFTPDALLRDKINEPLAHLETVELDDNIILPAADDVVVVDEQVSAEEPVNEPLQKLVEQAMELKDILADIQSLGVDSFAEEASIVDIPQQQDETIEELVELETIEPQPEVVAPIVVNESSQVEAQSIAESQDINETQTEVTDEPKEIYTETPQQDEKAEPQAATVITSPISARDIVSEINQQDTAPKRKKSWVWIVISIVLALSIIALLVYQNRSFLINKLQSVVAEASVADEDVSAESIVGVEPEIISIAQDSTLEVLNEEVISDTAAVEELIKPQIDTTSSIYNAQFPDLFNYPREYTEFIDTVTLNEGSRLTWIAFKQYGHKDFWVYIYEANRDVVSNPNSIKIGTKLRIPRVDSALIDASNQQCIDYALHLHDVYVRR